jgi:hypothetical protein
MIAPVHTESGFFHLLLTSFRYPFQLVAQRLECGRFTTAFSRTTVKIMPMAGFGMFQGGLRNGGKEMSGDWIQNGLRDDINAGKLTRYG